jgi:glycosyl transferase family 25
MTSTFEILNNFFDKIFVITLRRATERHEHIKKELDGLNYEFYFGEDKNDHSIHELEEKNIYNQPKAIHYHRYNKSMTLGHICCSWSHLHLYETIIKNNYHKVLIFEDDVHILKENFTVLSKTISQLPITWELLYLGWEKHEKQKVFAPVKKSVYQVQRLLGLHKWNKKQIKNLYPKKYSENLMKAGFHDCTHAYAITNTAANKLLQLQTPIAFNADSLLTYAVTTQMVEAYIAVPKIFKQLSQYSNELSHSFVTE